MTDDVENDASAKSERIALNRPSTGVTAGDLRSALGANPIRWSDDWVLGWRTKLADATLTTQRSVANEITRALSNWRSTTVTVDWAKVIASLKPNFDTVLADYRKQIADVVRPAALRAAQAFTAEISRLADAEREYLEALRNMGWWLPPSVDYRYYRQVGEMAHKGQRQAVRDYMNDLANSTYFREIVMGWMAIPAFQERKRFLADGLLDHRRGRYRVSIPTLLPHLEGIAAATFEPGTRRTNVTALLTEALTTERATMSDALVDAVTLLWAPIPFGNTGLSDRRLNRHLVLHGRSTLYGSQVNSTKVLFAFDLLASVVKDVERRREEPSVSAAAQTR
jgi:hypothetical protein